MLDPTYAPRPTAASPKAVLAWSFAIFAVLVLFGLWPELDLAASRAFFAPTPCPATAPDGAICGAFPAAWLPGFAMMRQTLQALPVGLAVLLALLLVARLRFARPVVTAWSLAATVALATYLVAVAFLVNAVLKEHWGRPRPWQTLPFAGDHQFVPAGIPSDACAANCSSWAR